MKRPAQQRSKRIEEEEEEDLPVKPAGRQAKKARTSGVPLLPFLTRYISMLQVFTKYAMGRLLTMI